MHILAHMPSVHASDSWSTATDAHTSCWDVDLEPVSLRCDRRYPHRDRPSHGQDRPQGCRLHLRQQVPPGALGHVRALCGAAEKCFVLGVVAGFAPGRPEPVSNQPACHELMGRLYHSDDCWMAFNRSAEGLQLPDPVKFPKGFKAVADAIHGMGMKSGLYTAKFAPRPVSVVRVQPLGCCGLTRARPSRLTHGFWTQRPAHLPKTGRKLPPRGTRRKAVGRMGRGLRQGWCG
jgi:hypothetical protein